MLYISVTLLGIIKSVSKFVTCQGSRFNQYMYNLFSYILDVINIHIVALKVEDGLYSSEIIVLY